MSVKGVSDVMALKGAMCASVLTTTLNLMLEQQGTKTNCDPFNSG